MESKIKYLAENYGIQSQLIKLIEEMSEVTKEITKLLNATDDKEILNIYRNTLPEELADLSIVYEQVVYLIGCDERMAVIKGYKVKRQLNRIKGEQYERD